MPFSKASVGETMLDEKTLKYVYENIIRKAVADYKEEDKNVFTQISRYESKIGSIISGIAGNLNEADLVIADLTGINPNVMYELGVRHTLRRGTIIISQDVKSLPSDLRDYMCVEYKFSNNVIEQEENYGSFKTNLHITMKELFSTHKYDSPVLSYLKGKERYWKEDEIKRLKENIVITDYIFEQFHQIEDAIKEIEKAKSHGLVLPQFFSVFCAYIGNLGSGIADLNISVEASILYEDIQAAKSLIADVQRSSFMTDFLQNAIPIPENEKVIFIEQKKRFFETKYLNYFKLNEDKIEEISFREIFSYDGDFYINFMDGLSEYMESKAKELGFTEEEAKKILTN